MTEAAGGELIPPGLEAVTDHRVVASSIGNTLLDKRTADGISVEGLVPVAFPAYARILHPASDPAGHPVRWREIAESTGAAFDSSVTFRRVTVSPGAEVPPGPQGAWEQDRTPADGTLPQREFELLSHVLRVQDGPVWFLIWEGWKGLRLHPAQITVSWLGNPHLVFRGELRRGMRFDWSGTWQTPHLWFPDDRTWCVGTEIDDYSTYVAGPDEIVQALESIDELEVLRTRADASGVRIGEWFVP